MLKGTLSANVTNDLVLDRSAEVETPQTPKLPPPPQGSEANAEKYLRQLIKLVDQDKVTVSRTDLRKFEIGYLQDHYFINLGDYEAEISHTKRPDTGKDFYVLLFNNIKKIEEGCSNKVILAYTHLSSELFQNFRKAAFEHLERKRQAIEDEKFQEALKPVDQVLDTISLQPNGKALEH